jgi:hypothetical protein
MEFLTGATGNGDEIAARRHQHPEDSTKPGRPIFWVARSSPHIIELAVEPEEVKAEQQLQRGA